MLADIDILGVDELMESPDPHDRVMGYFIFEQLIQDRFVDDQLTFADARELLRIVEQDIHAELRTDTATPTTSLFIFP